MPIDKINELLDCYFETLEIDDETVRTCIRNGIINRYNKYKDSFPVVSVNDDGFRNYIIKSNNGYYQLEDFLLNRLFQGLRYIVENEDENAKICQYAERNRTIYIARMAMIKAAMPFIANWEEKQKDFFIDLLMKTVFDHELGHSLKTQFIDGYKVRQDDAKTIIESLFEALTASLGEKKAKEILSSDNVPLPKSADDIYKELINNLSNISNGKYKSMLITQEELIDNYSHSIGTGINKENYISKKAIALIDELLQDTEAMENFNLYNTPQSKRIVGNNGNYINDYYIISGYSFMLGYGKILTSILGTKNLFQATYLNPRPVIDEFNNEYQEISNEIFQNDFSPFDNIGNSFQNLRENNDEELYLKLDLFFAKCYSQMITKRLNNNENIDITSILAEINSIQERLTTNDNEQIRDNLQHNIVLNELKSLLLKKVIEGENNQMEEKNEETKATEQKLDEFLFKALEYYSKEIAIPSNSYFSILKKNDMGENTDKCYYVIIYGYPQSGSIRIEFNVSKDGRGPYNITDEIVYATPPDKPMVSESYTPSSVLGSVSINVKMGLDIGTNEYKGAKEIGKNPNALSFIDYAISDLKKAIVMDECREIVPIGSEYIPMTNTVPFPKEKAPDDPGYPTP